MTSTVRSDSKPNNLKPKCVFCTGAHFSSSCNTFKDIDSRLKQMQGRCHCCLRTGHRAPECRSKRPCYYCRKDTHHQSLCRTPFRPGPGESSGTLIASTSEHKELGNLAVPEPKPESNLSLQTPGGKSILQTALANIEAKGGDMVARLYFDTGGSRSFISTAAAKKIGATCVGQETVSVGRFRDLKQASVTYKIFEFDICFPDGGSKTVRMSSETAISCPIQLIPLDPNCPIISQVKLAEPIVTKPSMVPIDILIGNDLYYSFIRAEQIRCPNGVVLLASPFGFIAGGLLASAKNFRDYESSLFIHTTKQSSDTIERFWRLEDLGIKENCYENDDEAALRMFNNTVQFKENRYFVKWPWKEESPELPDNYGLALGRLKSLIKWVREDDKLLTVYNQNIEEQKAKGIIEVAPRTPDGVVHYIPHHCVVSPSKTTTKVRIVYDASAKQSKNDASLNESLHRGPVFLANSIGILLRWRLPVIAMVSDIEKAFLQVGLQITERDSTRFLWLKDIHGPVAVHNLQVFRFCRVPFGVVSSPFLLEATVAHHLKSDRSSVASNIAANVYVDNVFGGSQYLSEAMEYYRQAKAIFTRASMNLREWFSNSAQFMQSIPTSDRGNGSATSVLGLKWKLETDDFNISIGQIPDQLQNWTKRQILQVLASVFDPLGLLCPVTVMGKLIMQQIWKEVTGWDEPVSSTTTQAWLSLLPDLKEISAFRIPRRLKSFIDGSAVQFELHCFCDASVKAYSAVVYLRVTQGSETTVDIIFAKNRVAPIKGLTIPRLELIAVLIGTRCLKLVKEQIRLPIAATYLWTDSSCVLHWIVKDKVTTVFVQNRLKEIRSSIQTSFRFVSSPENPADLPSRGVRLSDLKENKLWWHGPTWLTKTPDHWPQLLPTSNKKECQSESVTKAPCLIESESAIPTYFVDIQKFSSLQRLFRTTAYIFRFVRAGKAKDRHENLLVSTNELESAKRFWDKYIQAYHFHHLFQSKVDRKTKNFRSQLGLFIDSGGIIRCKGRYRSATDVHEREFPLLLPKNNPYTDLIIRDRHVKLMHAGVKHLLAEIRQNYWIVHARNQVKRVLKECRICRYYDGGTFRTPPSAPLPDFRTTQVKPFSTVGLDYLGPLLIRDPSSDSIKKIWMCLFTCATIRAIHLELVQDLTTDQFLLGLRRFVATYGSPSLIVSDNAKQFHMAEKGLRRKFIDILQNSKLHQLSAEKKISWKFIPELAPWMGGFYERLIGIVKSCLKKSIHQRCVTFTELQTLCLEIASTINTRPLLYSEETVEDDYLSPAHFLLRRPEILTAPADSEEYRPTPVTSDKLLTIWRRTKAVLDSFWKTWQTSYLQSLHDFIWKPNNRRSSVLKPEIGTVVIIKDKSFRSTWKLGIITELHQSHDRVCRSATIRTSSGASIRRPLKLLFPLESSIVDPTGTTLGINRQTSIKEDVPTAVPVRPTRAAAITAKETIKKMASPSSSEEEY